MTMRKETPEAITLAAGTTLVMFIRSGDRWEHEVRLADGRVWRSVEGPADEAGDPRWPASPPVVELSAVRTAAEPVLLGVGNAGRSHFSLSVSVCRTEPDTLLCDLACRVQEPAIWLGSTYAAVSGETRRLEAEFGTTAPATIRWAYTAGPAGLRLRSCGGSAEAGDRG